MCKILELCDQNPWRNNLSKLGTFDSILQRPHSAIFTRKKEISIRTQHVISMMCTAHATSHALVGFGVNCILEPDVDMS